jgi:hypothetical protein
VADEMAVEAVLGEPLSRPDSLPPSWRTKPSLLNSELHAVTKKMLE